MTLGVGGNIVDVAVDYSPIVVAILAGVVFAQILARKYFLIRTENHDEAGDEENHDAREKCNENVDCNLRVSHDAES